ncbi:MAG TPA: DUF929 family protein [Acidimicrobiales bacterium]
MTDDVAGESPAPTPSPRPARAPRRATTILLTWGVVGLVLVIVVVLVVIKLTSSSTPPGTAPLASPLPAAVTQQLTHIPAAVYDAVGVTSPSVAVTPPTVVAGRSVWTVNGKPGVLYVGAEFNPFCAAQRWAIVAALARFGKFAGLQTTQSSSTDVFGDTQTVTFASATFTSRYVTVALRERYGNVQNSSGTGWAVLDRLTGTEAAVTNRYDTPQYTGAATKGQSVPFMDVANRVVAGTSYSPSILQGLTTSQIATGLSTSKDPVTQAIVASANYLSASICSVDGYRPASVCTSRGVADASKALGLAS